MPSPILQSTTSAWRKLQPYFLAALIAVVADGLMNFGQSYLHGNFPWALMSLLIVAAVASFLGIRPAVLVLLSSALFGYYYEPDKVLSGDGVAFVSVHVRLLHVLLFGVCGGLLIAFAWQARAMRAREALRREVLQALQRMVMPETLALIPGYEVAFHYQPARQEEEVGGDFYDVFLVDAARGLYGIVMGDVVGKGKEAAEHTALLRYTARAYAAVCDGPAEILRRLNALVEAQRFTLGSASLFVGLLDAERGRLCYANAGHEPPLLSHPDGDEEALDATGPLIGIVEDALYAEATLDFSPGDSLLLVTDGVTEARDPQGRFLDDAGVRRLLRPSLRAPSAAGAVVEFQERLDTFMAGRQRDDIAILLLRRPAPRPARSLLTRLAPAPRATAKPR